MIITVPELDTTIKVWNLGKIKSFLQSVSLEDNEETVNNFFKYLAEDTNISGLSLNDKLYLLCYLRSVVIGDVIDNIHYKCPHCGRQTEGFYNITESISYKKCIDNTINFNNSIIQIVSTDNKIDSIYSIDSNRDRQFISDYIDNLTIKQASQLLNMINSIDAGFFNINPELNCMLCGAKSKTRELSIKEIIELAIGITLMDIYKLEINLKLKANFTINETLGLLPFERELYVKLINSENGDKE